MTRIFWVPGLPDKRSAAVFVKQMFPIYFSIDMCPAAN